MMKKLFWAASVAFVLTSCSNDQEVSVNNGRAIDFRSAMNVRGSETTTANLSEIYVTALHNDANFFENVKFSKAEGGTTFESEIKYYWPANNEKLNFFAYSPSLTELGGTMTINKDGQALADFSPKAEIKDQLDFVTAVAEGDKSNEASGVALAFSHRLSQIEIKAKMTNDSYVLKIYGVRMANPASKATFGMDDSKSVTLGDTKAVYTVKYTTPVTFSESTPMSSIMGDAGCGMLIPQTLTAWNTESDKENAQKGAYLAVLVNVTTKAGAPVYPVKASTKEGHNESDPSYAWVAIPVSTDWVAGNKYVYTLDFTNGFGFVAPSEDGDEDDPNIPEVDPSDPDTPKPGETTTGEPIKFTVTVSPWVESPENISM